MQIINQYSAAWIAAILLAVAGFFLLRGKPRWPRYLAFGLLALGLLAAWIILRPVQTAQALSAAQVEASIGAGKPVLIEFQSPY
jgi:type VI protein secretion system component VasK